MIVVQYNVGTYYVTHFCHIIVIDDRALAQHIAYSTTAPVEFVICTRIAVVCVCVCVYE